MRRSSGAETRGRVLVVDDEGMILDLLRIVLEGAGYTVATAASADALPEVLRAEAPDVVVIDLGLPGLPGDQAVRTIRREIGDGGLPVILYSGEDEGELRERARSSGADAVVAKTSPTMALLEAIEHAMEAAGRSVALAAAGER